RPFLDNDDVFTVMGYDPEVSRLFGNVSFKDIRVMAENTLRERWGRIGRKGTEDFKLTDIYRFMYELTGIPMSDLVPVMHKELDLEVRHIRPRRSVVEFFRLAKYLGKKTVLTSDMYLEHDHMVRILDACGITGYDRLLVSSEAGHTKYTGNLFKDLISYAGTDPKKIVHLGDSWSKDFENARSAGIVAVYVPRTVDVMDGKVQNVKTNDLGRLGELSTPAFVDGGCLRNSFGYGCMLKTVADRLFDHPYPSYDPSSDFNVSAEAMGYYPVGMHLLGIAEWIRRNTRGRKVVFLGRDGYLPKKAFDMLTGSTDSGYVACSRMALMPFSVSGPVDLLSLPIEPKAHSERSLTGMLDFCVEPDGKPLSDDRFASDGEYLDFVKGRLMGRVSKDRLERSRDLVRRYYRSRIPEGSYVFDMGYSGRLAYALKAALGYDVTFLYVYRNTEAEVYGDVHGLDIRTMYPYEPFVSGFLREFLLSEPGNRCIGFEEKDGEPVPILVSAPRTKLTSYAVDEVQGYALEFVGDYLGRYRDVPPAFSFDPVSVSLPFETMLSSMKESDRRLFIDSFEDDTVYGGKDEVSVHDLLTYSVEEKGRSVLEGKQRGPCPMVHTAHRGRDPFRSKYVNWAYYKAIAFGRLMRKKFRI
ncbi:MAG: hypothetical protein MJZ68_09345, partial [archaeon]|nr:hypothetical protein [archaeon]